MRRLHAAIEVARTPRDARFLAGKVFVRTASRAGHEPESFPIFLEAKAATKLELQQRPTSAETQPLRLVDLRHAEDQVPAIALNEVPGVRP